MAPAWRGQLYIGSEIGFRLFRKQPRARALFVLEINSYVPRARREEKRTLEWWTPRLTVLSSIAFNRRYYPSIRKVSANSRNTARVFVAIIERHLHGCDAKIVFVCCPFVGRESCRAWWMMVILYGFTRMAKQFIVV